ncbi:MAG TPA: sigma 54-interacting transcriptional regulator [Pyrinomonadaceae bacterium]|nr:sigma 54-interacting transcriptional regulator [Pyrinomonadaceae bacterium]
MSSNSILTKSGLKPKNVSVFGAKAKLHSNTAKNSAKPASAEIIKLAGQKLTGGFSAEAERILRDAIENQTHATDDLANLKRLLAYTLETLGRYKESIEIIRLYETEEILHSLEIETQIKVITQLAICYNNLSDYPKAVTLLKQKLQKAKENDLPHLFGRIHIALSRVYRKLNEQAIARDHAEKALHSFRENGKWRGMAESYQAIATSFYQEGNSEKSLEYFELAIKIVGERSAPFLLGKLYSDMSGAYCLLRRPQDGIACLEKSIKFFDQTEHKLNSVIAYNNLGMNLMLLGDWNRAETMMKRALDLAVEANHVHVAGILDSLGELKLLRGELKESQNLLEQATKFAEERKKEFYAIQAMRNLARCFLAQGKTAEAIEKAQETVELCKAIGEKQMINAAGLILAESYLQEGRLKECEFKLQRIEENDLSADFFILGNIQRIYGLLSRERDDDETAAYHFNRGLTIFETADDIYHIALTKYLLGKSLAENEPEKAAKNLISASEIFRKLGVDNLYKAAEKAIEKLRTDDEPHKKTNVSAGSQLSMLRLAEATASRELLFRELVAVLQQESKARKIIVAEINDQRRFFPFIAHGYTPSESMELVAQIDEAQVQNNLEDFAKTKNLSIFPLRAPNASPAMLIVFPRSGAALSDGGSIQPLLRVVSLGMDVCALRDKDKVQQVEHESSPFTSNSLMPGFIHSSPAMTSLVEEVYKIRSSDVTVLVTGESGTGKELVSRAIHAISNRKDRIFIPFNCTAVPKELAEGHLFGYRKGAFTGAVNDSQGMIRAAHGGTLFLDEVGDLPLDVQPKLLRFLQEGEVQPIGDKTPIKVDVRVIAATNMPLEEKVANGSFREDLYYRLNVIRLRVPPLRERRSEIPPIINYYINHYSSRFGKRDISITPQTIDLLMVCEWEGNVRQLCNEIQRVIARAVDGEVITPEHLSLDLKRNATPISAMEEHGNVSPITSSGTFGGYTIGIQGATLESAVSELETQMIVDALRRHDWNISRVSRELGLTRRGLYLKLARYGIEKSA